MEDQINETKHLLRKLRYAILSDFYKTSSSEQVQKNIQENSIVSSGILELDQKPIHPAIKKLIAKRPARSQEASGSSVVATADEKHLKTQTLKEDAGKLVQLTSSRGRNQLKHTIVVGNTSQFIKQQTSSDITHKWMCYVKTKSCIPIERLVKKVRFHLDPSYKPNEVIDVASSPFQLTRRGHSDFTIKLEIFFKDEIQLKPVQIHHQLMLDKRLSGHQVLGNETTTEVFTNNFLPKGEIETKRARVEQLRSENK